MSDEAWLELSSLLVQTSPGLKNRLCNTLRHIDPEEESHWLERFVHQNEYDQQYVAPTRNSFVHEPLPPPTYHYNQHANFRYYSGRPYSKLMVKFVDDEEAFEFMLDYLQVGLAF